MKKHTLQEWCDFLGVAAVKNNFRVKADPPGVFHNKQITVFIDKPDVTPQSYGAPCWVDRNRYEIQEGEIKLDIDTIIGSEIWQLVSDIDDVQDFSLYLPDDWGDARPVKGLSGDSIRHMAMADKMQPATGLKVKPTRGDPIDITLTKHVEETV